MMCNSKNKLADLHAKANTLHKNIMECLNITNKEDLICPYESSYMTPCIARDGHLAMDEDEKCVGCGLSLSELEEGLLCNQ